MMKSIQSFLFLCILAPSLRAQAPVWPGKSWPTATPKSRGLSKTALDAVAKYALKAGGGSGCVIRHGYLVKEWGSATTRADIKSATKGSFGITLLGLAYDAGLIKLDDRAQKYYPKIGIEKAGNMKTGWLKEITVRQLATMTAGFDDGRPPRLVYRPGTKGVYSNDGSNMLAELLTLRFKKDLYEVMKEKVMDRIGASPKNWSWRKNSYRKRTIDDITNREIASGIRITHRALARIGYLYLRSGKWKDQQIISKKFIDIATKPTKLPGPWPYYACYWGSNGIGTFPEIPRDVYWAWGLGDSFVLVCPSLDIVVVRLGVGSRRSMLPGGIDWGKRAAVFFSKVSKAVEHKDSTKRSTEKIDDAPYPRSPVIRRVQWAPKNTILRLARGSDNWPITWADDDNLYTGYGDGWGFHPKVPKKLSLGLAKVTGNLPKIKGLNIRAPSIELTGGGSSGGKPSGILMIDGVLYIWVRNTNNSRLAWSTDHGRNWTWADWRFTTSFGYPTFLNFGKNYAGARDNYVYVYSHDQDSAYKPADRMVLARVRKDQIKKQSAYEYFEQLDATGKPRWTKDIAKRGAVFTHTRNCYRSSVSYNAGLKRYLWCQTLHGTDARFQGGFGIYDAPQPWGPWTTVYFTKKWDVGPGETNCLPTKWMSRDGRTCHLVFSGDDCFSVRRVEFELDDK